MSRIISKFWVGDIVWVFYLGYAMQVKVWEVTITFTKPSKYILRSIDEVTSYEGFNENQIFATKEELLASL